MTDSEPLPGPVPESISKKRNVTLLLIGVGIAALLVGGGIGTAAGVASQQPALSEAAITAADQDDTIDQLEAQNDKINKNLKTAIDEAGDMQAREAAVAAREAAVKTVEQAKARQEVANGMWLIGTQIDPGVYQTSGPTGSSPCYYVWKTGTGADAQIVDNNLVSGPATITLEAGQVFETSRCQTWTKVG